NLPGGCRAAARCGGGDRLGAAGDPGQAPADRPWWGLQWAEGTAHHRGDPPRSSPGAAAARSGARCSSRGVRFGADGRRLNVILQEPSGKADELADWQMTPLPGQQSDRAAVEQERELATRSIEVSAGA